MYYIHREGTCRDFYMLKIAKQMRMFGNREDDIPIEKIEMVVKGDV